MSTSMSARPTRRTVVRGAAWSVPVVAVAAVAPAYAASQNAFVSSTADTAYKWSEGDSKDAPKHVSWDFTLRTGGREVSQVSVAFTYAPNGGGGSGTFTALDIYIHSPLVETVSAWNITGVPPASNSATATRAGILATNTTYSIHTDFMGSDNSTGTLTATITVTYVGGGSQTLPTLTEQWKQASPGNTEPAPHSSH